MQKSVKQNLDQGNAFDSKRNSQVKAFENPMLYTKIIGPDQVFIIKSDPFLVFKVGSSRFIPLESNFSCSIY